MVDSNFAFIDPVSAVYYKGGGGSGWLCAYQIDYVIYIYIESAVICICALWSPAGKGLTSWLSFVVSTVSLSLYHRYPGSGVVLNCIDS